MNNDMIYIDPRKLTHLDKAFYELRRYYPLISIYDYGCEKRYLYDISSLEVEHKYSEVILVKGKVAQVRNLKFKPTYSISFGDF